jgi:DNA ligase N terminus
VNSLMQLGADVENCDGEPERESCLTDFFRSVPERDLLWVAFLLRGGRPHRLCTRSRMTAWAKNALPFPAWLIDDALAASGDLAEAVALLFGEKRHPGFSIPHLRQVLDELRVVSAEVRGKRIAEIWNMLDMRQREMFNRLALGSPISSIRERVVHRALSRHLGVHEEAVGFWFFTHRTAERMRMTDFLRWVSVRQFHSYPFHATDGFPGITEMENQGGWGIEHITGRERVQLIKNNGEAYLWSEERSCMHADSILAAGLPDGLVLECGYASEAPLSAYALLEYQGAPVGAMAPDEQRHVLDRLCACLPDQLLQCSQPLGHLNGSELDRMHSALQGTQDWILFRSRKSSTPGHWIRWDAEPHAIDCVLLSVRRDDTAVCGEMTLGVWDGDDLVPCARLRPALSTGEEEQIARAVADSTVARFGPVSGLRPSMVFVLEFDAVERSARHKSGLKLRNPRIREWKKNAAPRQAGTLAGLTALEAHRSGVRSDTAAPSLSLNL